MKCPSETLQNLPHFWNMKNEKTTWAFIQVWQILKHFARAFHQA